MSNQTKRNYTQEFKQEAVKRVTEQGYKVSEATVGTIPWWSASSEA